MRDDLNSIQVGHESVPIRKKITQDKINSYAEASSDFNPLHIDPEFAKGTRFGGTIAHGLLSAAFISEMMTSWFGKGWLYGGELEIKFVGPVQPGDTIVTKGKVMEIENDGVKRYAVCEVSCENQKEKQVIVGTAKAYLS